MKIEISALQIAIAIAAVKNHIKESQEAEFAHNGFFSKDYYLSECNELKNILDAAFQKYLQKEGK